MTHRGVAEVGEQLAQRGQLLHRVDALPTGRPLRPIQPLPAAKFKICANSLSCITTPSSVGLPELVARLVPFRKQIASILRTALLLF